MKPLILLGIFAGSFFLFLSLYMVVFSRSLHLKERLASLKTVPGAERDEDEETLPEEKVSVGKKSLGERLRSFTGLEKYLAKRRKQLIQASILMKAEEFLLFTILASVFLFFLLYALTKNVLLGIPGLFLGFRLPDLFILSVKKRKNQKVNEQLPDALNAIANSLRSGLSFTQSMAIAVKEMEQPIAEEFSRVIKDNALGKPLDEALMDLSLRNDDEDMDMLVTAVMIQRQVGGNLAEVLDVITGTIRERMRIKGEVRTLTSQGKMSALVVGLLPVTIALMIYSMNPEYMTVLFTESMGKLMIGLAVTMELIGAYLLSKIIKIQV